MLPAVPCNVTCALSECPAPFISSMVKLGPLVNAKKLPGVRLREYWVLFVAFGSRDPRYYINPYACGVVAVLVVVLCAGMSFDAGPKSSFLKYCGSCGQARCCLIEEANNGKSYCSRMERWT